MSRSVRIDAVKTAVLGFALIAFCTAATGYALPPEGIRALIGERDAVLIASSRGRPVFEKNADKHLVPASILKIFTALAAFHYLGPEYRFRTEFYLGPDKDLKIKGYGDPLLISETLAGIAAQLSRHIRHYNDLELDDSFFLNPLRIPGTSPTFEPYDAPGGALCVNFNTVNFKRSNNSTVSAEEQTPLLPFVEQRIESSALDSGRIILSDRNDESTLYAGHLFKYFLQQAGIDSNGGIKIGRVQKERDRLLLTFASPFPLRQVVGKLLDFSNNFIANQILLAAGAQVYGPPGTLDKGIRAALSFAEGTLGIQELALAEGSGIARENRISARSMVKVLDAFESYHDLLRRQDSEFYKTGNLTGVATRAGYLLNRKGELYRFVVMLNTPGKSIHPIMKEIRRMVASLDN